MSDGKALCIFAFNRPRYLKRCLDSIATNTELDQWEPHLFLDGAVNKFSGRIVTPPENVFNCLALAKAHPLKPIVHLRDHNFGVALQQYDAYNVLQAEGYRWVSVLEEDVIISPHYLRICRLLMPFLDIDELAFSATPAFLRHRCAPEDIKKKLSHVELGGNPWIGYMADLEKWNLLKTVFNEYMAMVNTVDYKFRPHLKIREWFKTKGWPNKASSQDGGKEASIRALGMRRYRTRVNRGFYIGEEGTHGRKHQYDSQGWARHIPFVHDGDATVELELKAHNE